jgi:hypothetical protein
MTTNSLLSILLVAFCCVFSSKAQNSDNGKDGVLCSSTDISATLLSTAGKFSGVATEVNSKFVSQIDLTSRMSSRFLYSIYTLLHTLLFSFLLTNQ